MTKTLWISPLLEKDIKTADQITRTAFGTFYQLPEPQTFMGDANVIYTRYCGNPQWAFGAHIGDRLVGSIIFARWGSFAYFGPLAVNPEFWGMGIAKQLIRPVLDLFDKWQVPLTGLFTFGHSPGHLSLYHGFGFRARGLTLILEKKILTDPGKSDTFTCFSHLDEQEQNKTLAACIQLTGSIFDSLDLTHEISSIFRQNLGDTLLLFENKQLAGFAACQTGGGTEAGSNSCYIKFAAAAPGINAANRFNRLLSACTSWARAQKAEKLTAGINVERQEAYDILLESGFDIIHAGVAMLRPNCPGFNTPSAFVMDGWR